MVTRPGSLYVIAFYHPCTHKVTVNGIEVNQSPSSNMLLFVEVMCVQVLLLGGWEELRGTLRSGHATPE